MFDALAWGVPLLPLAAALLILVGGRALFRGQSHLVCLLGLLGSFACAVGLLLGPAAEQPLEVAGWKWLAAGDFTVGFDLRCDALAAQMLTMVTGVATLVAIYSAGYMHGDRGYIRFFATVALFVASMTLLVLAGNLVLLYLGWEAVGLCSYLLIGHYHGKASAAAAARKAFLVNRIGDVGLLLGIFWMRSLVTAVAPYAPDPLSFGTIFDHAAKIAAADPNGLAGACLLLFAGAVGKSAQFPLHVWLPDAMEGPSPVSALIHAATMVTAGVYLVARLQPVLQHVPVVQVAIAAVGTFTALMAALIALTQHDLKRVLAYSTASQLGFMFAALGASAGNPAFGGVPPVDPCVLQGVALPFGGQRDARDGRCRRHAAVRRTAESAPLHACGLPRRCARAGGDSAAVGFLEQGRHPRGGLPRRQARSVWRRFCGRSHRLARHGVPHGLLHLSGVFPDLPRRRALPRRSRRPPA